MGAADCKNPSTPGNADAAGALFGPCSDPAQARRRFERILDSTPDGIMVMDPSRRVVFVNKACGEMLGRDPADVKRTNCVCGELVNCHAADGQTLAAQLCPARELFAGSHRPQTEQMLATNARGEERWIETSYSPILDAQGRVEFVIGVMRDIHERRKLESRLMQTEKLASLGALTAGIAHEIKNPLGIILSAVEIVMDEARPAEMRREAATYIKEEVARLDERLRGFLQFARPKAAHPEPVAVGAAVRRTMDAVASSARELRTEFDLADPDAAALVDPDHLRQVITNLVLNASEAIDGAGRLLVRTRRDADTVRIEFHDSGPGVEPAIVARLFDPFFTTKASGTGLGLSVVYQIVAEAKGRIEVLRSPELGGALFRIEFPALRNGA